MSFSSSRPTGRRLNDVDLVSGQACGRPPARAVGISNNSVTRKAAVSTVAYISLCLMSALCFYPIGAHAQRAIVAGLGTRIKQTFTGGPTNSGKQPNFLQQGEEHGALHGLLFGGLMLNRSPVGFTMLAIVLGFIAMMLYHQHRRVTHYERRLSFVDYDQGGGELDFLPSIESLSYVSIG